MKGQWLSSKAAGQIYFKYFSMVWLTMQYLYRKSYHELVPREDNNKNYKFASGKKISFPVSGSALSKIGHICRFLACYRVLSIFPATLISIWIFKWRQTQNESISRLLSLGVSFVICFDFVLDSKFIVCVWNVNEGNIYPNVISGL